jgi:beta-glucanase (GH16 family)
MLSSSAPIAKPWLTDRDPMARIAYALTYAVAFIGVATSVIRCYTGYKGVPMLRQNLCVVMDEQFDSEDGVFGDNGTWFREVEMSGFGNGQFEMTTNSENNSFVRNGALHIAPTLTSDNIGGAAIFDGYTYNITGCTFNITQASSYTSDGASDPTAATTAGPDGFNAAEYYKACGAVSNRTTGAVINPVQSARISTRRSASIRYGKVEVVAKLPTGDWLWPAIWMLPVENAYGPWPMSGEIDIMEARGNGPAYPAQGADYVRGSLNWGPQTFINAVALTYGWWTQRRSAYDRGYHTYGLEWDQDFIRMYVDSRLHKTFELKFSRPFFARGNFPAVVQNGSAAVVLQDPWGNATAGGANAAPFDREFYLILDVAVGGTNGWFPDKAGGKPWLDGSANAMGDFARAQGAWYPTWPQDVEKRALVVDSVKMWKLC